MSNVLADLDAKLIEEVRTLIDCPNGAAIQAWYDTNRPDYSDISSAHAAGFGTLSAMTETLLGIIDRQQAEIERLQRCITGLGAPIAL